MAERAKMSGTEEEKPVFDLANDERWKARLEEARARRAAALREKGISEEPRRPRRPWEEEGAATDWTPAPTSADGRIARDGGPEFSDRIDRLRALVDPGASEPGRPENRDMAASPRKRPNRGHNRRPPEPERAPVPPEPAPAPEPPAAPVVSTRDPLETPRMVAPTEAAVPDPTHGRRRRPGVDTIFEDPAFAAQQAEPEPEPVSLLVDPIGPRPAEVKPAWRAALEEIERERDTARPEPQPEPDAAAAPEERPRSREGLPFALALAMMLLAAMPFFNWLPPVERGPASAAVPAFPFQPALGLTTALVAVPEPSFPGEWRPASLQPPSAPVPAVFAPPADFARWVAGPTSIPAAGPGQPDFAVPRPGAGLPGVPRYPRSFLQPRPYADDVPLSLGGMPTVLTGISGDALLPPSRPPVRR